MQESPLGIACNGTVNVPAGPYHATYYSFDEIGQWVVVDRALLEPGTARPWTAAKSEYSSIAPDSPVSRRFGAGTRTPQKSVAEPNAEAFGSSRG